MGGRILSKKDAACKGDGMGRRLSFLPSRRRRYPQGHTLVHVKSAWNTYCNYVLACLSCCKLSGSKFGGKIYKYALQYLDEADIKN